MAASIRKVPLPQHRSTREGHGAGSEAGAEDEVSVELEEEKDAKEREGREGGKSDCAGFTTGASTALSGTLTLEVAVDAASARST